MCIASQVPSLIDCVVVPVSAMVLPETSIKDVIAQMPDTGDSCVVVTQKLRPVGTFTEQEVIRSATLAQTLLENPISTVMIPIGITIFASEIKDAFSIFQQMQQQHLYHLPVIDYTGEMLGTITQHSLKKAFCPINAQLMTIKQKSVKKETVEEETVEEKTGKKKATEESISQENLKDKSLPRNSPEQLLIEQVKGEFIAMVSHELRTPLTSIHGGIKLLSQGIVSSESAQGQYLLQVAAENSERLVALVTDILELERLESRVALFQRRLINTQDLTRQITELSSALIKKKNIRLEVIDEGVQIVADGDRLIQVFTYLLDNAIRFSSAGSTIKITVALIASHIEGDNLQEDNPLNLDALDCREASVLFSICDQGIGILPEQRHKIFERFVQGDRCYIEADTKTNTQTQTTHAGGTGLGLSICQNIVEQHDGRIWVQSQPGKGSCFHFMLPTRC